MMDESFHSKSSKRSARSGKFPSLASPRQVAINDKLFTPVLSSPLSKGRTDLQEHLQNEFDSSQHSASLRNMKIPPDRLPSGTRPGPGGAGRRAQTPGGGAVGSGGGGGGGPLPPGGLGLGGARPSSRGPGRQLAGGAPASGRQTAPARGLTNGRAAAAAAAGPPPPPSAPGAAPRPWGSPAGPPSPLSATTDADDGESGGQRRRRRSGFGPGTPPTAEGGEPLPRRLATPLTVGALGRGRARPLAFRPVTPAELGAFRARRAEKKQQIAEGKLVSSQQRFTEKIARHHWLQTDEEQEQNRERAHVKDCMCGKCWKQKKEGKPRDGRTFYKMLGAESKLVRAILSTHGLYLTQKNEAASLLWSSQILKAYAFKAFRPWQRVNQFPRTWELTRKDALAHNLNRMREIHGDRSFSFMPLCFVLPKEREALAEAMRKRQRTWIVKPAGSACGRGIYLATKLSQMPEMKEGNWIVSEYIDRPLLIDGFKFDLRIYVAVTSFHPLRIYVHEEGLCRLASRQYSNDPSLVRDRFIHLTNYSINKKNKEVAINANTLDQNDPEESSSTKLSFSKLKEKLSLLGVNCNQLWKDIDDVIIKTLISIEEKVTPAVQQFVSHRNVCFQMFGFDILVDDQHNPWLMEVNFSPSLNTDTALDHRVKSQVLSDVFNLAKIQPMKGGWKEMGGKSPYSTEVAMDPHAPERFDMTRHLRKKERMKITADERVVREALEEGRRAGGFRRAFPSPRAPEYLQFFISQRPLNNRLIGKVLEQELVNRQRQADLDNLLPSPDRLSRKTRRRRRGGGGEGRQDGKSGSSRAEQSHEGADRLPVHGDNKVLLSSQQGERRNQTSDAAGFRDDDDDHFVPSNVQEDFLNKTVIKTMVQMSPEKRTAWMQACTVYMH